MTIRNLPPVMEGPDFEEQVASIRANRTFYMPRRGPDGFYSLLIYRPKSPRIITGGSEAEVRRELNAGADVVVSLRTRSVYISPMLRPTPDREIRYCGCAPDSRECQCPRMDMGAPPANGRMIDDDHPEMQKNIAAERCTAGGARSTAESNYQRVMGNHGWRNENPEPTEIAPGEELVLGEGLRCQDCEAVMIRRTLTGPADKTLDAYFIRAETNETACWIEAHSEELLPCSDGQHRHWIERQPPESEF